MINELAHRDFVHDHFNDAFCFDPEPFKKLDYYKDWKPTPADMKLSEESVK